MLTFVKIRTRDEWDRFSNMLNVTSRELWDVNKEDSCVEIGTVGNVIYKAKIKSCDYFLRASWIDEKYLISYERFEEIFKDKKLRALKREAVQ